MPNLPPSSLRRRPGLATKGISALAIGVATLAGASPLIVGGLVADIAANPADEPGPLGLDGVSRDDERTMVWLNRGGHPLRPMTAEGFSAAASRHSVFAAVAGAVDALLAAHDKDDFVTTCGPIASPEQREAMRAQATSNKLSLTHVGR